MFVDFKNRYPETSLQAFSTIFVREEVLAHKVDLEIGLCGTSDKRLVLLPLGSEPYELFVHSGSELTKWQAVTLEELIQHALVKYPKGYLGRNLVDNVCREQGFELNTVMEAGSASSLLQLVEAGIGEPIQPKELLKLHREGHISYRSL
ncbi:LysR family transcriptional regulator substrate-binding protein [Bacillales bacterium AN1005]